MVYRLARFAFILGTLALLQSCSLSESGVQQTNRKQEEITDTASLAVPFPKITSFQELKILSTLYTIRDKSVNTFSFTQANDGTLIKICNSYGFPTPYGDQFSNPEKVKLYSSGAVVVPQAEPTGKYTGTATTSASWLLCFAPGGLYPFYAEGNLFVSPVDITGPMVKGQFALNFGGTAPLITDQDLAEIKKEVAVPKLLNAN